MEPEPEPEPEPQIKLHQFTEEFQGVRVHGLFALFTGTAFVWIGNDSRTMPNLSASSSNKYSPMPAVSTLMAAAAEQSSVSSERAEAFSQHLAKKLPNVMVLASYQLPAEPAILHEVVSKEVLKRLQPLVDEAAAAAGAAAAASQQQGGGA